MTVQIRYSMISTWHYVMVILILDIKRISYLWSISSTLNAQILRTKAFFLVTFWLWTNFRTKNCAFNVDEIDGRLENAVLNPFYRPPRGRWKGSVTMLLYVVLVVANYLIFCFRTVNVLAVDTFSTHKTLQVFWQTIRETQT